MLDASLRLSRCSPAHRVLSALCLVTLLACASAPRASAPATTTAPPPAAGPPTGKLPAEVRPTAYQLELEIVPSRERFSGHARISIELAVAQSEIWLHAKGLTISHAQAQLTGRNLDAGFQQLNDDGLAKLAFGEALPAGAAVLDLTFDAPFDHQLSGLYKVDSEGAAYAFTQFEPVRARQAFPCFDQPSFKTPFDIALNVPADQVAISNTPELSSEPSGEGMKRVRFATTKPLPTYLIAFIVGPLDVVTAAPIAANEVRATPLALRGVAVKGKGERMQYALEHTAPIVAELERYFGIAYPFEKLDLIAVPDFGGGAMENAGAITFRDSLLFVDPVSAPEWQRRRYANVTAHEIAHHWTGDLVTMAWWDDTWLNEAFATFLAARVVAAVFPEQRAPEALLTSVLGVMDQDSRVSARKIRQPIESTHDIANAFDGITYQKGAGVLAMFERYLGAEVFRSAMQRYLREHAYGNATAADLIAALSRASGEDVSGPMSSFLDQVGVPLVSVQPQCAAEGAALVLSQMRYLPAGSGGSRDQFWQVPVCVRYGVHGSINESCMLLSGAEARMPLAEGCPDWILPNADGASYYRWALLPADLDKLRNAGFAKLSARDKLSFADSLRAAFASAALPAASVFAALPALAADADRSVASMPLELLHFTREYLLEPAGRPALERFVRTLYGARLQKLGWKEHAGEDGDTKLLRGDMLGGLAHVARDAQVRKTAAGLGVRLLHADAKTASVADVPTDLRSVAVTVALQDGDAALFELTYKRFAEATDPVERDRLLGALSSVTDARSARALALTFDPVLHQNEVTTPLRLQFNDERTRAAAYQYMQEHLDALIEKVSKDRAGGLPWFATPLCSAETADRLEALFAPRIDQLTGGPRSLAGATEALRLCAAEVAAQEQSARSFFNAHH